MEPERVQLTMSVELKFTDLTGTIAEEYWPRPASQAIPEWYANLAPYQDRAKAGRFGNQTAKKCAPMMDVFFTGYILFTVVDIRVSRDEAGFFCYEWPSVNEVPMDFQQTWQLGEHKRITSDYATIPKMPNPWGIVTPKGYSCLVIPPVNRDDAVFEIFSGVIDTDRFHSNGNLPFRLLEGGFEGVIPAGTPMAQVIPFRRNSYRMAIGDESDRAAQNKQRFHLRSVFVNGYRKKFWQRKEYR